MLCASARGIGSDEINDAAAGRLDEQIAVLIVQLGDERYTIRERAQAELSKFGFVAFEALNDAQQNDDIEIALRARYLVRSMRINWSRDDDPPVVKAILRGYEQLGVDQRVKRMTALTHLDLAIGTEALCRLARFERTEVLSKQAALMVMRQPIPDGGDVDYRVVTIRETLGRSRRSAADWLRIYSMSLENAVASTDGWDQMVWQEEQLLGEFPEQSSRSIVQNLLRRQSEMLYRLQRDERADAAIRRLFRLINGDGDELLETIDWLTEQQAWAMIVETEERFPNSYGTTPLLLYRLAHAYSELGRDDASEDAAARALKINEGDGEQHVRIAYQLQTRGMFRWAEQEFRYIIDVGPPGSSSYLRSHFLLSEMLHDQSDDQNAAEVLRDVVEVLDADASAVILAGRLNRQPSTVKSRMHFFYSEYFQSVGDPVRQEEHLKTAIEFDPTDADVLIAMYRQVNKDEAWKKQTSELIKTAADEFRKQIKESPKYPTAYNQLAWLISNSEGDYDEALRCSLKSLELLPNTAGYLDTLGRAYYAKGDLENAAKTQARAVRLDPFSGQIKRQHDFFARELEKSEPEPGTGVR